MIVFSYGIQKSGSTLGYQLARVSCEKAGFAQPQLPPDLAGRERKENFTPDVSAANIRRLVDFAPGPAPLVVKVHAALDADAWALVRDLIGEGRVKVHAIYRDPREVCLSLVDAGERARRSNRPAFHGVVTLDDAIAWTEPQLGAFLNWASLPGAMILRYDALAFDTRATAKAMAAHLGLTLTWWRQRGVLREVLGNRFIQFNKGEPQRHLQEMTPEQLAETTARFATFIRKACEEQDETWMRAHPMAPAPAGAG
jgi:hypothetical protein